MVKNRIIAVLMWAFFLAWVYGRNRFTEDEQIAKYNREVLNKPEYIARREAFAKELEEEPGLREAYNMLKYELALDDIEMGDFENET